MMDELTEMIASTKGRKSAHNKSKKISGGSVEREFTQFATDIAKYYPEVLTNKEEFLNHISQYIKTGIKDFQKRNNVS